MANTKINLMAFIPKADVPTVIHTVGMPCDLRDVLFRLMPPRKEGQCLATNQLKDELRCWLDQAVELNPLYPNQECANWLVALKPVDLERLCNVVANWVTYTCREEARCSEDYRQVMSLLTPEVFSGAVVQRKESLFDEEGRPAAKAEGLTFPAFSAQVANAVVGKRLDLPNGTSLVFSRVSRGTKGDYELMSHVLQYEGNPYSVVLRFHVETLPVGRRARLNVDVSVRRYIAEKWQDKPYMSKRVNAFVRTDNGTFRLMPYGYSKEHGGPDWDKQARANYEGAGMGVLPKIEDYLANIGAYAQEGHSPQILSPCSPFTTWAKDSKVKTGVSMADKAAIFGFLAEALSELVVPEEPLESVRSTSLHAAFNDANKKQRKEQPDKAKEVHEEWARSNRRRLAASTGESRVVFEIVSTSADGDVANRVRGEITHFLGGTGDFGGLDVEIRETHCDELLSPLKGTGDASAKLRWRKVEQAFGKVTCLTACIVVLPGAESFKDSERGGESHDPKTALRMGLARSGRLSQFLVPEDDGSLDYRACVAVRDLMRQLGFIPELRATNGGVDLAIPVIGLRVYNSPLGKLDAQIPIAVRLEAGEGRVSVDCPLFDDGRLPYWKAQLKLAQLSTSDQYARVLAKLDGNSLRRMLDNMRVSAAPETLLLVQAYGRIRHPHWWPGLSDASLARGALYYGPTKVKLACTEDVPFDTEGSGLNVLRVRSAADKEVPDYFTDAKPPSDESEDALPSHYCKQGLFPMDGYVLALTAKPNNKDYNGSLCTSKFDHPDWHFAEKTLNEYCLLTSDDRDRALEYSRYAEALRGTMVQLYKSDMRVNLPAPLHLAEKMEEYLWAPRRQGSG